MGGYGACFLCVNGCTRGLFAMDEQGSLIVMDEWRNRELACQGGTENLVILNEWGNMGLLVTDEWMDTRPACHG